MLGRCVAVVVVSLWLGCGAGPKNVEACEALKSNLAQCKDTAGAALVCEQFDKTGCDVSGYFTCLRDHYACRAGKWDLDGGAHAEAECNAKAACQ